MTREQKDELMENILAGPLRYSASQLYVAALEVFKERPKWYRLRNMIDYDTLLCDAERSLNMETRSERSWK